MLKSERSLKSVRNFLEKHPALHEKASSCFSATETTLRKIGLKLPRIPHKSYFQLISAFDNYQKPLIPPEGSPHVLFYTPRLWMSHTLFENMVAIALSLRGVKCSFGNCDGNLPICNIQNINQGLRMPCDDCRRGFTELFQHSSFPNYPISKYLKTINISDVLRLTHSLSYDQLENFIYEGIPLGKIVKISVRWFLAANNIPDVKNGVSVYQSFLASAIVVFHASKDLLKEVQPDVIFMLNGLFFEERIICSLAAKQFTPVVTYECGFLKNTFIFARNKIACHYDLSEHWVNSSQNPLTEKENNWLDDYLMDRQFGKRCVIQYWPKVEERVSIIRKQLRIPEGKKAVALFTNIVWDSAVQEREIFFADMFDWLLKTLKFFIKKTEYQLIVRVHPAEVRLKGRQTRERAGDHIRNYFPELPSNITIVDAESDISSYRLIEMSDFVIVYTSTIGLEASLLGKPVIVAGESHYRDKGFTIDPNSLSDYFQKITKQLNFDPKELVTDIATARKYAYLFFHEHMIDFSSAFEQDTISKTSFNFESIEELGSPNHPELDNLCRFIIESAGNTTRYALLRSGYLKSQKIIF